MKASKENVFPGALVKKGGEEYTVIKVNENPDFHVYMSEEDFNNYENE